MGYVRVGALHELAQEINSPPRRGVPQGRGGKMKNNKGFTLIELLVVMALIAITVGVIGISSVSTASANLRRNANAVDSILSRARINSMHRADVYVEFTKRGSNITVRYYEDGASVEERQLDRVDIYSIETDGIENSLPFRIEFSRRGALIDGDGNAVPGKLTEIYFKNDSLTYIIEITHSTGNRRIRAG